MKLKIIIICLLAHFQLISQELTNQPFSDEVSATKNDGRFIAELKSIGVDDPSGLMSSFDIKLQWWSLLSEPIEYYDITWQNTGAYKLDDRTITRTQLEKYPDLLKRFDNLRPYKMAIKIQGKADAGTVTVKRGKLPSEVNILDANRGDAFKKDGQSYDRYTLSGGFSYVIGDAVLLPSKAGKLGKGIVSNSPHWNHFLFWGYGHEKYYEEGDKEDFKLENENKQRFSKAQKINLRAQLYQLKWPMVELKDIAMRYDQYEEGIMEPSPLEEIEDRNKKEVSTLTTYDKDDFWGEIDVIKKETLEFFETNGLYGLRTSESKIVRINAEYYGIEQLQINQYTKADLEKEGFKTNYWILQIKENSYRTESNIAEDRNTKILVDEYGKQIIPFKFNGLYGATVKYSEKYKYETVRVSEYLESAGLCRGVYMKAKQRYHLYRLSDFSLLEKGEYTSDVNCK